VVGCSFTQGWGLDDAETFPWLLQRRLAEVRVRNFGTGGYGTYQSLLRIERALQTKSALRRFVVYGFADFHEARNVAAHAWLKALAAGSGDAVRVPYCSFDHDGALRREPPIGYRTWPFDGVLASVRLVEDRLESLAAPVREGQARAVTQALLGEMDRVVRDAGARFIVVELAVRDAATKRAYASYAREHGIDLVDCAPPELYRPSMRLRGDLHPNASMNRVWADCIEKQVVQTRIEARGDGGP
jgi:lysophospholipase L1-like esterase